MSEKHLNPSGEFKISMKKYENVDFDDAMEFTGFGKYNLILIVVCGLTLYGVNSESYAVGYVLPAAECDLNLNTYTKGILTSTNFIGIMGSCCLWGYLSDTRGRKNMLMFSLFMAFITSIVAAVIPSFWGFAILRFFNGIFLSGPSAVIFAYFGEFQSKTYRSRAMAFATVFIGFALTALPGLGWILLPQSIHFEFLGLKINSWRLFMMIQAIPSLIVSIAFTQLAESPKYLYHSGNIEGALAVMKKVYAVNSGRPEDSFPVESLQQKVLLQSKATRNVLTDLWNQIAPLFMIPHLKYSLSACLIQGSAFAVSSGLFLWYPDIINQLSNSARDGVGMTVCQALSQSQTNIEQIGECNANIDTEVFVQNLIIGLTYLTGYTAWGFVVKFIGNRNFFVLCMVVSSAAIVLVTFLTQKVVIDVLFILLLTLPGICVSVISSSIVDIMPTHLCGMAVCITMTAGRLGSIVSSSIVGLMLQWNCTTTFALYAVSLICSLLLAFIFPRYPNVRNE